MRAATDADYAALSEWQIAMRQMCGQFTTQLPAHGSGFIGQIQCNDQHALPMASIRTNAGRIFRMGTNAEREDVDHCFLVVNSAGFTRVTHESRQMDVAPGEIFLLNSLHPCEMVPRGLIEHTSVPINRNKVEKTLGASGPAFGKIDQSTTSGLMIRTMLQQLGQINGHQGNNGLQRDALEDAILALLKPSLQNDHSTITLTQAPQHSRDVWQAAQVIINRDIHLDLSPATLAAQLNVSIRQLHRIFEEHNDSVCRYIQRSRLQRCAEDLTSQQQLNESVTTIAYKWGFSDAAHFSRSFKKQFGTSPREYRNQTINRLAS